MTNQKWHMENEAAAKFLFDCLLRAGFRIGRAILRLEFIYLESNLLKAPICA